MINSIKTGIPFVAVASCALCLLAQQSQGQQNSNASATETVEVTAEAVVLKFSKQELTAGDSLRFTMTLDKAPNFSGGLVQYSVSGPEHVKAVNNCTPVAGLPREYDCEFPIPAVGPPGNWKIKSVYFLVGNKKVPLVHQSYEFRVRKNTAIVLPTTAEMSVTFSQAQLLRREAERINEQIQSLKQSIASYESGTDQGRATSVLRENLRSAMEALVTTQRKFVELASSETRSDDATTFFNDLRTNYEDALGIVEKSSLPDRRIKIVPAKYAPAISIDALLATSLRPMEQNELAYNVVANSGSLTFDLEVDSDPVGAVVTYHRRGDSPHQHPEPTNSTIRSLPYAIWIVGLERPGYAATHKEYDPFREVNRVMHVKLQPQK